MCEDPSPIEEPAEDEDAETEALAEVERRIEQERPKFQPLTKELENVNLGDERNKKEVRIGNQMSPESRRTLVELLMEFSDIFAWSYRDMPGLDRNIVEHRLHMLLGSVPVRQQLRRMKPDVALRIKEEVEKQWDVGFLAVSNYPQWVANIVPVPKKDGKVRMCVDYRDLNRASSKDNFSLPHIDMLIDNTPCHAFFSFMDDFSEYNQILMAEKDREKTTFVTLWGTFCYKVMPFGLKNDGATYQRAMEIEVYVDDMIAKSKTLEQHIEDLRKLFDKLRKYRLRLNPAKCTFGVKSGKLLGFTLSERGIEVDPDKVKAIREMPPPTTNSEVRGFLGRINFIAQFISQLTATCNPICKFLKKRQKFEWDTECQRAFKRIKQYLERPPVLVPTILGKPLILYLIVLDESMGCMLGQQDETGKEHAVYYLSKKFTECEKHYPTLERTCCALVWAAKRLRPYMLSHSVRLVAKTDPIKYILEKPALTGRIARWQMALSEYDVTCVSRHAIKGSSRWQSHNP
ncbi:Retrovirus-related Pol polyprotein from transposon 17.6, partial [Mucuna pruriens]